ncbi:MAG: hypothetical protein IJ390_01785 [Lachnospiraceae bacterium]|nr:hypothetical protein [Lachnospiraceae bacterium]
MNAKKKCAVIVLQIFILFGLAAFIFAEKSNCDTIDTAIEDWRSRYTDYSGSWYIDSTYYNGSGTTDFIYGPYVELPKGSYTVTLWYECDSDQSFLPFASQGNSAFLKAGTAKLSRNKNVFSYKFIAGQDVDNFEVVVKYNGIGALEIFDIAIESNLVNLTKLFVILLAVFAAADCWLFYLKNAQESRRTFGMALLIGLFVSLPLFISGINIGHDLRFHLMRIEGIAQEIRSGNIPVRLSSLWMDGYGYPVSVYYGDLLLYIPALLRIAGFSIEESYKFYVLFINFGTSLVSLLSFRRIFKDEKIALFTTFAYVTASYRLVDIYIRAAVGEYSALMFLPMIALAVCEIYRSDAKDHAFCKKNALLLALGMTGVIGTHILTAEMAVILLVLICVVLWKKTFCRKTILTYLLAAVQTLCLNLYFLVPFLDYYKNVTVKINDTVSGDTVKKIQSGGAYIAQYFAFFQDAFGHNSAEVNDRMLLTPGIVLMAALIFGMILWFLKKGNRETRFLTAFSALVLFIASDLFPWDYLAYNSKLGNMLAQVQFPWRYIGIALILLALLAGNLLKQDMTFLFHKKVNLMGWGAAVCVGMTCVFLSSYVESAYVGKFTETAELDDYRVINGEYLRLETDMDQLSQLGSDVIADNMVTAEILERNGTEMELYCEAGENGGSVELPLFHYRGYYAADERGREFELTDGTNAVIKLSLPAGYEGNIHVGFRSPWYWRAAEVISFISVLWAAFWALRR